MPIYDPEAPSPEPPDLLLRNEEWASAMTRRDPAFFERLVAQQTPKYLWIGCSDSRVPANEIVGLAPGELFVHRNVANLVVENDLNCLAVLQYAVDILKVEHIIVTGHYGCGGIRAVLENSQTGLVEVWLRPVEQVVREHGEAIRKLPTFNEQWDRLCELNVKAQVEAVTRTSIVKKAWERDQPVSVHGWVYGIQDGLVHTLGEPRTRLTNLANRMQVEQK